MWCNELIAYTSEWMKELVEESEIMCSRHKITELLVSTACDVGPQSPL